MARTPIIIPAPEAHPGAKGGVDAGVYAREPDGGHRLLFRAVGQVNRSYPAHRMPYTFVIDGANKPARAVLTWPVWPEGANIPYLGVRLEYTGMTAAWEIDDRIDRWAFARFFKEVASRGEQSVDVLSVHSLDSDLTIVADQAYDWPDRVALIIELSCDTQDPYWTSKLRVEVPKSDLEKLAAEAAAFFVAVGAG